MIDDKGLRKLQYLPDVTIFEEGEDASEAYLIHEGKVRITRETDGEEVELAVLEAGDTLGEMSLIKKRPRSAKAVAVEKTLLIIITEDILNEKMGKADGLLKAIVHKLTERLYKQNDDTIKNQ